MQVALGDLGECEVVSWLTVTGAQRLNWLLVDNDAEQRTKWGIRLRVRARRDGVLHPCCIQYSSSLITL